MDPSFVDGKSRSIVGSESATASSALVGIVASVVTLVSGVTAMLAGEMVPGYSSARSAAVPELPGELVSLIGLLTLVMCVWLLWRLLTDKA